MKKHFIAICLLMISLGFFAQEGVTSQDLKINDLLYGTLRTPQGPSSKLAIIIPGSGPTDRNGNQSMQRSDVYKKLSQQLALNDIAAFSYDKRIFTLARQNALKEEELDFDTFVTDVVAIVQFFEQNSGYDGIYLIGHSQGALVGALAAQQLDVSGYISLCGAGQSIDQTILSQIELQMPGLKASANEAFKTLKQKGFVKDFNPALISILRPSVQPFMYSWMQYSPKEEIKELTVPTFIIGGSKDIQTDVKEQLLLKNAVPEAEYLMIENMNHVLLAIDGDDLENVKSYNQPERTLHPDLIPAITEFINKN